MKTIRLLVLLPFFAGCYIEPSGLQWTGDKTTSTECDLGNEVQIRADGPVYCAAIAANWQMAHDAIVPRFTTDEEWNLMMKGLVITVHTTERCISAPGDGNSCTYEVTHMNGSDSFDWSPQSMESNNAGVQFTHEALHVVSAWNNVPSSSHQGWDKNGYYDLGYEMADKAYRITP